MELLIKLSDNTHSDPAKDLRCWKRGDVVMAMPDGHQWGAEEGPPKFCVLKMPGVSVDKAQSFLAPDMETVEVPSNLPFEELQKQPDYKARTDGKQNFVTVTRMKARRQIAVDIDAVASKIANGTFPGQLTTTNTTVTEVATATVSEDDLATLEKPRVGVDPVIIDPTPVEEPITDITPT